jgi:hypothetical protein
MHREEPEDWFWQGSPTMLDLLILMPKQANVNVEWDKN